MPLRLYHCPCCGIDFKTKVEDPVHCGDQHAEQVITPPSTKFMEKQDADRGKSQLVGQQQILRERARKHSRDNDTHDLIQNNEREVAHQNRWLTPDGKVRKPMDDK